MKELKPIFWFYVVNIALFIVALLVIGYFTKGCKRTERNPIVSTHTEKVRDFHDSIKVIETKYVPVYKLIADSKKPDTLVRYILRLDTVKVNHDSFIAVEIVKGKECREIISFKDSIIKADSVEIERLNSQVKSVEKQVRKVKIKAAGIAILSVIIGIFIGK